jgi:hypothetical protein
MRNSIYPPIVTRCKEQITKKKKLDENKMMKYKMLREELPFFLHTYQPTDHKRRGPMIPTQDNAKFLSATNPNALLSLCSGLQRNKHRCKRGGNSSLSTMVKTNKVQPLTYPKASALLDQNRRGRQVETRVRHQRMIVRIVKGINLENNNWKMLA